MAKKKDSRLARAGVSGFNKPKRTPSHPKKSHIVNVKALKLDTVRILEKVKCLQLIGLIKLSGSKCKVSLD